jgi:hypothetical protein
MYILIINISIKLNCRTQASTAQTSIFQSIDSANQHTNLSLQQFDQASFVFSNAFISNINVLSCSVSLIAFDFDFKNSFLTCNFSAVVSNAAASSRLILFYTHFENFISANSLNQSNVVYHIHYFQLMKKINEDFFSMIEQSL